MKNLYFVLLSFLFALAVNKVAAQEDTVITHSIIVGGVTESSANFWVRTNYPADVRIEAALDAEFTISEASNLYQTLDSTNNTVVVTVSQLSADTKYFYRAWVNGKVDTTFKKLRYFHTFPSPGVETSFSFAFGACQQSGSLLPSESYPGKVFDEIAKHDDIRLFLQLGDWTYPDTTDITLVDNNYYASYPDTIRANYAYKFRKEYPMDSVFSRMPVDYVYDDHDYMNDNASALTSSYFLPFRPNPLGNDFGAIEVPNPAGARENSIRIYKEQFPGYELENESRGIYHKFTFGNVEFYALDLRSQRDGSMFAFDSTNMIWTFNPDEDHSILGRDDAPGTGQSQFDWFLNQLKNSTADWKFIMSSVPFNAAQRYGLYAGIQLQDSVDARLEQAVGVSGATGIFAAFEFADKWCGYPADQDSLIKFVMQNQIEGIIWLSGDSHNSAIDDGTNASSLFGTQTSAMMPEIMSGGLEITNSKIIALLETFGISIWNRGGQGISTADFNNSFGKVTIHGADSVTMQLIDENGTLFAQYTAKSTAVSVDDQLTGFVPGEYKLNQNYPNPFNPSTVIEYSIPVKSNVTLKIYDILGREVANLVNGEIAAGNHSIEFDASKLASGTYFYQLKAGSFTQTNKMILLK